MNDDYLWDGQGEVDPEIARLERALAPFQYQPASHKAPFQRKTRQSWRMPVALAAAALILTAASIAWRTRTAHNLSGWTIYTSDASPRVLRRGQVIETGPKSSARLESSTIGEVHIDPQSRIRLVNATNANHTLALDHGTIHAFIWAPPRQFVVDTPSATTVDLGCEYTLQVAPDGTGVLKVEMGWVAFQWKNLESFIPAGAACRTRSGRGPGTPYFLDASDTLKHELARFDESNDPDAVGHILSSAQPHDALTLWHLMTRTQGPERLKVFARFAELVPLPATVTEEKIAAGDPETLNACWNALGFGTTDWWREWKRRW
ncbi:MAG: FecR domain-containing protein [Acidobacteriaceae bacterium]|nr:FecR domain-containing protein [Acidobacteriaceae bacterium]MBV9501920.1 FecR domain-containing protein [Acidobacteriaceae bacterium]